MGSHRRSSGTAGPERRDLRPLPRRTVLTRAVVIAGAGLVVGTVALLLATRPDTPFADAFGAAPGSTVAQVAVPEAPPAPPSGPTGEPTGEPTAAPTGPLTGSWSGPLADPDTVTTRLVLSADGSEPGLVAALPVLGCTYLGPAAPATGTVTDLRASEGSGPSCLATARVRLSPDPASGTVRYDVLEGCGPAGCAPRRAGGVLTPSPPGP